MPTRIPARRSSIPIPTGRRILALRNWRDKLCHAILGRLGRHRRPGRAASGLAPLDGATQTLPMLYSLQQSGDFHDITIRQQWLCGRPRIRPGDWYWHAADELARACLGEQPGGEFAGPALRDHAGHRYDHHHDAFGLRRQFQHGLRPGFGSRRAISASTALPLLLTRRRSPTSITFHFATTPVTAIGLQTETLSGILDSLNESAHDALHRALPLRSPSDPGHLDDSPAVGSVATCR